MTVAMKQIYFAAAIVVASCGLPMSSAVARSELDRDLDGYAIASCMIASHSPVLIEQGHGWAGAIVQRSHGPIKIFQQIASAVNQEIRVSGFALGHRDGPVQSSRLNLFMVTCGEIVDNRRVAIAIARARVSLVRYYNKSR